MSGCGLQLLVGSGIGLKCHDVPASTIIYAANHGVPVVRNVATFPAPPPPKQAAEFFQGLDGLKKQKKSFSVLLTEMQRRRGAKRTEEGKLKYDKIITDLSRILALLKQKKVRSLPSRYF